MQHFRWLCQIFLFLTLAFSFEQQETVTLTGRVLDQANQLPLEYATLVLQSVDDPSKVTGGITDIDGKFNVEAIKGRYNIRVEYISYKTYASENQNITADWDLGTISLQIDATQLDAVEAIGDKTTVEVRLDKKIYNRGKDITTSGGTLSGGTFLPEPYPSYGG